MAKEIEDGIVPDPMAPVDPETGAPLDPNAQIMEPEIDGSATEAPELPKGGEI